MIAIVFLICIILFLIFITVGLCLGVRVSVQEGMLLDKLGKWGNKQGVWVYPLFACEWCMPSVYTVVAMALAWGLGIIHLGWWLVYAYPIVALSSTFLSGTLWGLMELILSSKKEKE